MGRRRSISNGLISAIAIAAVAAVAIRAALVASRSDGGWEILRDHFVAGLPPIFGVPANQVDPRLATADSLVREANRSGADPHSTAADLMGAALVLSDMQPNYYMSRSLPDPASVGYLMWTTKLPAIDVHWREGYRTMLLRLSRISPRGHKSGARPRRLVAVGHTGRVYGANRWEEWLDFSMDQKRLEASAEHDRDNALYPYLLGYQNFRRAFEMKSRCPMRIQQMEQLPRRRQTATFLPTSACSKPVGLGTSTVWKSQFCRRAPAVFRPLPISLLKPMVGSPISLPG